MRCASPPESVADGEVEVRDGFGVLVGVVVEEEFCEVELRERQLRAKPDLCADGDGLSIVGRRLVVVALQRRCIAQQPARAGQERRVLKRERRARGEMACQRSGVRCVVHQHGSLQRGNDHVRLSLPRIECVPLGVDLGPCLIRGTYQGGAGEIGSRFRNAAGTQLFAQMDQRSHASGYRKVSQGRASQFFGAGNQEVACLGGGHEIPIDVKEQHILDEAVDLHGRVACSRRQLAQFLP